MKDVPHRDRIAAHWARHAAVAHSPPVAWPLRTTVTDLAGRPVTFHALTLGGDLIIPVGPPSGTPVIRRLAGGDTLSATTPAQYPLDLTRGSVVFFTSGKDSIRRRRRTQSRRCDRPRQRRRPSARGAARQRYGRDRHAMIRLVDERKQALPISVRWSTAREDSTICQNCRPCISVICSTR